MDNAVTYLNSCLEVRPTYMIKVHLIVCAIALHDAHHQSNGGSERQESRDSTHAPALVYRIRFLSHRSLFVRGQSFRDKVTMVGNVLLQSPVQPFNRGEHRAH